MKYFFIFSAIFCWSCSFGQQMVLPVGSWNAYSVPTNKDTLLKYNLSQKYWYVFLKDGKVYARNSQKKNSDFLPFKIDENDFFQFGGEKSVMKGDDGYLIGFDHGEFGGNLYWFSLNGKFKEKIVGGMPIIQFIKHDDRIFAIEGLAHMGFSRGGIMEIKFVDDEWKAVPNLQLPSAPAVIDIDSKNNFIVVTSKSLLQIDSAKKIDVLIDEGFWSIYLYPNSLVVKNNVVYVGMAKGVLKFDLATRKQEWLMPD